MTKTLTLTAMFLLLGSTAMAQLTSQDVVASLQAQGYTPIEVKTGPSQIKAEAVRDGQRIEVVYDAATGQILKQEVGPAGAQTGAGGIEFDVENDDFVQSAGSTVGGVSTSDDGTPDQGSGDIGSTVGGSTDDDGTPDQGSGDFGGDDSATPGDDDGTPDQGSGDDVADDNSGSGSGSDDGDDNSGSGSDGDDGDDNSGSGSGSDDGDDNSGSGSDGDDGDDNSDDSEDDDSEDDDSEDDDSEDDDDAGDDD